MQAKNNKHPGEVYLRPGGFFYGRQAQQAARQGVGGLLPRARWCAFSSVEVIERGSARTVRQWVPFKDIVASNEPVIKRRMDSLLASAKPFPTLPVLFEKPQIMGIVNVTPDSFSDGGAFLAPEAGVRHGKALMAQGADILDIGGESTRPGAEPVSIEEEIRRVVPVLSGLAPAAKKTGVPLSLDSRNGAVMRAGLKAGAGFINDVTALSHDDEALGIVAGAGVPVCLMHSQGTPQTMQDKPDYDDVVLDVFDYLEERIDVCETAGVDRDRIIIDPGIGFGKTVAHNLALLDQIAIFHGAGVPVLLGASRKSFIGKLAGVERADQRMSGSVAAAVSAVMAGVQVVRVHDVDETAQAFKVLMAIWSTG